LAGRSALGWGPVACAFARLLQPFECRVLVASNALSADEAAACRVARAALGEVLGASRVVSIHKGLTDGTRGFLGARELDLLRPGTVLLNTARGQLIDEAALIARVNRGDIIVGLDVFDREPLPPRHPLRRLHNVILTPHSASATPECRMRVGRQAVELLLAWIAGDPLPAITLEHLARMT
jgi:phosphoglycerate dehydrogenase-like enzyme